MNETSVQPNFMDLDSGPAPLSVEVTRGALVESRHAVHGVLVDAAGRRLASWGDAERMTYPRSALKPLQALALVETGAADAFAVTVDELALACASHNAEPAQVEVVTGWLSRLGLGVDDLECGPQWPRREADRDRLIRAGAQPTAADNNCSGKHAGMLAVARHLGVPTAGYTALDHPVQRAIFGIIAEMVDCDLAQAPVGIDGCSAPNPGLPLAGLALAAARFAAPDGLAPARAAACRRLAEAMAAAPFMVAGSGRLCTVLMQATAGRVLAKTGAEGVYLAAVPEHGLGLALKAEDGAGRAAQAALGALLGRLGLLDPAARTAIAPYVRPVLSNWRGLEVGAIRAAGAD